LQIDTANEWYITGVQLEAGTTASDFEFLPVDVNLQRCHRYCYAFTRIMVLVTLLVTEAILHGYVAGSIVHIFYPTTFRAIPTISYGEGGGAVTSDLSNISETLLYDTDDSGFFVFDLIAEAEL
jgi:hypothetical protein